jgi:hypothetical protein
MEDIFDIIAVLDVILSGISIYYYIIAIRHNHRSHWLDIIKLISCILLGSLYLSIAISSQISGSVASTNPFVPFARLVVTYALVVSVYDSYKASHRRASDDNR